jgi:hypothetical protein
MILILSSCCSKIENLIIIDLVVCTFLSFFLSALLSEFINFSSLGNFNALRAVL